MADNQTIFLKRIRETRPDLANQSDKALTSIFSKIRPDIFQNELTKPVEPKVTITIGSDDEDKLNALGMSIPMKQSQPQYTFTAIKDPEVKDMNEGFFQGLQDAFSQTQERVKFFKENPEQAESIKGQATAYQFEPLLNYLDPKEDEPITSRVGKELILLTAGAPIMGMTMAEDPIGGISQYAEFLSDIASNWIKLVDPDKREEGWGEIKRSPLFHTLPLFSGIRKAQKAGRISPQKRQQLAKEVEVDINNFKKNAEQILLENKDFFKELQDMSRSQVKTLDFNKEIVRSKKVKLLPERKPSEKILKIDAELANLKETKKMQEQALQNPNLTEIQRTQAERSLGRVNELIEENRVQGQQLGYTVNTDILPDKNIVTDKGTKRTVDVNEYFNKRMEGKGYNPAELDRLYSEVTSNVILLPESKGAHSSVQDFYEKSFKDMSGFNTKSWQDTKNKLVRGFVDVSGNIKKELRQSGPFGEKAAMLHDLALGANNKSALIYEEAAKRIFDGLGKHERKLLDTIIESRRNITIQEYKPNYKVPGGYEGHLAYLKEIKKSDPRLYDKLNKKADQFFLEEKTNLKELYDNGLIPEKTYELLKDKDYTRKEFIDKVDPEISYIRNGRKINVPSSGLKRLEEGSQKTVNLDQSVKLFRNISMIQSRIAKNKANVAFRDMIRESPNNIMGLELKPGEKPPKGYSPVSYFEKGQKKEFYLKSEFANEWVTSDPRFAANTANIISLISGNRALKTMATGANPEFALVNMPRDIGYVYLTTSEYSPHLPKFGAQMALDLASVATDAIRKKGRYRDYIMEGGGMEFLTHQGGFGKSYRPTGRISNTFEALQSAARYLGETSEIWTRLALRERALKNGKSPLQATYEARNYLDFAQGGSVVKALDSGLPYLNATVQATRGLMRSPKKDPKGFATKSAWIAGTASSLWFANNVVNPKAYNDINERIKNDNWIVTTPFSYTDDRGNKRYMYFKLPKDTGQKLVASATDAMLEKSYLGKDASDQAIEAVKDLASVVPAQDPLPPLLDALIMGGINHNFFKGEPIFDDRGRPVEPEAEFIPGRTGKFFVDFGEKLGEIDEGDVIPDMFKSPAKLEYMTKQFTTHRNIWTDIVGGGYKALTGEQDEKATEELTLEMMRNIPGIRRFVSFTNPYKQDKELERTLIKKNTDDKKRREFGNEIFKKYKSGEMTRTEVLKSIKDSEFEDKKKIKDRIIFSFKIKDVRNPGLFYDGLELPPELRAGLFFDKYKESEPEERTLLMKEMKSVPRFASKDFKKRFNYLVKQYLQEQK